MTLFHTVKLQMPIITISALSLRKGDLRIPLGICKFLESFWFIPRFLGFCVLFSAFHTILFTTKTADSPQKFSLIPSHLYTHVKSELSAYCSGLLFIIIAITVLGWGSPPAPRHVSGVKGIAIPYYCFLYVASSLALLSPTCCLLSELLEN